MANFAGKESFVIDCLVMKGVFACIECIYCIEPITGVLRP